MPVEIREIVIRAVITEDQKPQAQAIESDMDRTQLIQDCVDEVFKALKRKKLR
ncbi:DUF5908 family protein [Fulvivirga sediminis]|uniref:Uncharacterized protein n=1 Tax=Fulvivirga sediminis TaxID=2803949 RepID=A0A937JZS8_9BACT|nr:DUF5908 family protein [Fulvivirga sediminis]MBL3655541.1 hypothetical protein [Fulvivirga sediminis]